MPRPKKVKKEEPEVQVAVEENKEEKKPIKKRGKLLSGKFDLFSNDNIIAEQKDLMAKAGKASGFKSITEVNKDNLPVPWMALQYLIGKIGITANTFNEIIGQECVGKSSLMIALACNFINNNIPTLYINTEPKQIEGPWLARLAGKDKARGRQILERLPITQCYSYDEMDATVRNWIKVQRQDLGISNDTPLVVIVDSITHLKTPEEAAVTADGKTAKDGGIFKSLTKGVQDVGGKIASAATWMSVWTRLFAEQLDKFNVTMLLVCGQSVKMSASPAGGLAGDGGLSLNGERIGGNAMKRDAGLRFTVTRAGFLKSSDGKRNIGEKIRARNLKNSFGSKMGDIEYFIKNKDWKDGPDTVDQAINMDKALGEILVAEDVLGFKVTRGKYTSLQLGIEDLDATQLAEKINSDEELQVKIGQALGINGYEAFDE